MVIETTKDPHIQELLVKDSLFKQLNSFQSKFEADLSVIIRIFLNPLKEKSLISQKNIEAIFINLETLKMV